MKKLAIFIVNKHNTILIIMLVLAVVCAVLQTQVGVNTDMTKYLPDDSGMKIGMDIMNAEFPETEPNYTIRVMFDDLSDAQKLDVLQDLQTIANVKSVDYQAGDSAYNKDNHTLFVLNTPYDYGTKEENSIEDALRNGFSAYTMSFQNDDIGMESIPLWIIGLALLILMVILFIMCQSWIEPLLFLVPIGVSILLNMGTNIFMGEISEITFSIASILQLVLSMDYSIILINRYRQELQTTENKYEAMKSALTHAFSSIASSTLTTVVGLLVLVFMSFKIGTDFAVVLAKGVFLSMVCTLTVLPGIILLSDNLIRKTAKKSLHIKTGALATFSYRFRYVITGFFVVLFVAMFFLKGNTAITYTLDRNDQIADIFPASNPIILLSENKDDATVTAIADEISQDEHVKSVSSYALTLGKEYTAAELSSQLSEMGGDMNIDPSLLQIIYYDYYMKDAQPKVTAGAFIDFISNDVLTNPAFSDYFDDSLKDNITTLQKFANPENLTTPMDAAQLADFFGLSADEVQGLLLLYHTANNDIDTGEMALSDFAAFLNESVLSNPHYAAILDQNMLAQMEMLRTFTDTNLMTKPQSIEGISSMLGMDQATVKMLFAYCYALSDAYDPGTMTLSDMVAFMANDVAQNPLFAASLDKETLAQIEMLSAFMDKNAIEAELTAAQLAAALQMDESMVAQLFQMRYGADSADKTMSLQAFVEFLLQTASQAPQLSAMMNPSALEQLALMQSVMEAVTSGKAFAPEEMSALLGMDAAMTRMLYAFYTADHGDTSDWQLSMQTIVDFLMSHSAEFGAMLDGEAMAGLQAAHALIDGAVAGTQYSASELSALLGIDASLVNQLYLLHASQQPDMPGWGISVQQFVDFITSDVLTQDAYKDQLGAGMAEQLNTAKSLITAVVSGDEYTAADLATLFAGLSDELDSSTMDLMLLYYASTKDSDPNWKLSIATLFDYLSGTLMKDARFDSFIDDSLRGEIDTLKQQLNDGAAQLRGPNYSRLIIDTSFPADSEETMAFIDKLIAESDANLTGNYYLIGNSVMNHEMMNSFEGEMNFITILTAIAIFLVILFTFRSLSIPIILVLVIQCGVFLTISIIGLQGYRIYYLALLIVQCILMGATIDYGILFTSYYRENRQALGVKEALAGAYRGSIHTILTSGSIMILITAILGYCFDNPTIGQICMTISQGALCATLLILFILPGLLATFDRVVIGKSGRGKTSRNKEAN